MGYTTSDLDGASLLLLSQGQRYLPDHCAFHALHLEYHFCFSPKTHSSKPRKVF